MTDFVDIFAINFKKVGFIKFFIFLSIIFSINAI
jgi:hypothetical protein